MHASKPGKNDQDRYCIGCSYPLLLGPVVVLILGAAVGLRVPYWMTFWISRPFMDAVAERALADDRPLPSMSFIGLYPVSRVERVAGGVKFYVDGAGFLSSHGFLYRERPLPIDRIGEYWIPRPGHWVEFQEGFMGALFH